MIIYFRFLLFSFLIFLNWHVKSKFEQLARPTVPKMETEGGGVDNRPPCIETEQLPEAMDTQEGKRIVYNF